MSSLLYASNLTSGRDQLGPAVKFVVPVVTNGKVYVGTQKEVDVFGLLNGETYAAAPTMTPGSGTYTVNVQVTMVSATPNAKIYYTTDGSVPSTGATLYSAPITLTSFCNREGDCRRNGFHSEPGDVERVCDFDADGNAIVTSPPAGSYATAQTVAISDTTANAVIYYTLDGTTPTHASQKYTAPITISNSGSIRAIASAPPLSDSPVTIATYTIATGGTTSINFGLGFANQGCMQFQRHHGPGRTAACNSPTAALNEAGSAFCTTQADVRAFTTDFTFQLSDAQADGITFTIQKSAAGATALGPAGGALGYGAGSANGVGDITKSVAVNLTSTTTMAKATIRPAFSSMARRRLLTSQDMTASGVDLHSGDTMAVHMTYDGTTLSMSITDAVVNATFTQSWLVNIPATVGSDFAYVGFTGGTGGLAASQKNRIMDLGFHCASDFAAKWTIVTISETAPNATPLTDVNGNPYPCSGQGADNSGDANPNCYNPLVITTDWKATPTPTGSSVAAGAGQHVYEFHCSVTPITTFTVTGYAAVGSYNAIIQVGFQSGETITFTGASSTTSGQFSGTFTSTGACMGGDSGSFTATLFTHAVRLLFRIVRIFHRKARPPWCRWRCNGCELQRHRHIHAGGRSGGVFLQFDGEYVAGKFVRDQRRERRRDGNVRIR